MTDNELPNCRECGHNHDVTIVEGLADTYDGVLYRVCCSSCGGDWTWEWVCHIPDEFIVDDLPSDEWITKLCAAMGVGRKYDG